MESFVCPNEFSFNENYLIWGKRINEFNSLNRKLNYEKLENGERTELAQIEFKNGVINNYTNDIENVNYWNKILENNIILNINLCSTELENGKFHEYLKKK